MSYTTSKPGKHGSAKVQFTGLDIFTAKKQVETYGTGDKMDAPVVKRSDMQFMSMDEEGLCQLMDAEGNIVEVPILSVYLISEVKAQDGHIFKKYGKISFVDLAGSERLK